MGKTKGVTALNYLAYVKKRATGDKLDRIMAEMDPAARKLLFESPIAAGDFVDYAAVMQMLLAADRLLGKGDLNLLREASQHNQISNLNGIYKALLPFASAEFIIKNAAKLWQRYHDTGSVTTEMLAKTKLLLTLHDYPNIPLHHGPEIEGAFEGLLILAKAKVAAVTHTQCVNQGAPTCQWEICWLD